MEIRELADKNYELLKTNPRHPSLQLKRIEELWSARVGQHYAVSKNGPCWVDAAAFMTGARINFQTLRIDNSVGDGFIIQKISSGEAYQVSLKPGVFPTKQAELEAHIRAARAEGKSVTAAEINELERQAEQLSQKMLATPPSALLEVRPLPNYRFVPMDLLGGRGDIVNKDMPR